MAGYSISINGASYESPYFCKVGKEDYCTPEYIQMFKDCVTSGGSDCFEYGRHTALAFKEIGDKKLKSHENPENVLGALAAYEEAMNFAAAVNDRDTYRNLSKQTVYYSLTLVNDYRMTREEVERKVSEMREEYK